MAGSNKSFFKIKDRKLGDEWLDWHGDVDSYEKDAIAGKRIFVGISLIIIIVLGVLGFGFWYMMTPRLAQFHPLLPAAFGLILIFFWSIAVLWFFLMVLSIWTEKDFLLRLGGKEFSLTFLVPVALKFGIKLGISRDRMSHSFVKVSNTLIRTRARRVTPEKLLILLPRCLQKSIREQITSFSRYMRIPVYTVPGGEKARELIHRIKPSAIIGVACERDLLSGIQDVIRYIPVIGIPNVRPEGPCKNTIIDLGEFEKAIQTFLGTDVHLLSA